MQPKSFKLSFAIVLSLTVLAAVLAPASEAGDHRLRIAVEEPFYVDGVLHSPNIVTVRQIGDYNPNAIFAEVWVGNECLGQLIAEVDADSADSDVDSVLFSRHPQGHLVMVGVSFRGEPTRMLVPSMTAVKRQQQQTEEPVSATVASLGR